jgi:predicted dehydrogenase
MNKKIGIIGCESKHAEFFGALFNVDRVFPNYSASFILGNDAPQRLAYVQEKTQIPNLCQTEQEIIEKSDALLITYRMSEKHYQPAMNCIRMRKPVFIDKPFSLTVEEALAIANNSLTHKVPILGGSTLCFDPQIQQKVTHSPTPKLAIIAYQADDDSPFGGYRFYGSHLTDLCSIIFNDQPLSVRSNNSGESITTTVRYLHNIGILHSTPNSSKPQVMMSTNHSLILFVLDDEHCYYYGMQAFIQLIEKGEPDKQHLQRLISSVNILDAVMRSLDTGKEIKITEQHI